MIKSVTVTNHFGESVTMELRFPEQSGFLISGIDGLSPGKATINTVGIATRDGAIYNSAHLPPRNIVMSLVYIEKPLVEDTRRKTYQYFSIKNQVLLKFVTDKRSCIITGYVESNEVDIFSSAEKSLISIVCPDPYFYSTDIENKIFSGIEDTFEFPFSNESLTEDLIIFGEIQHKTVETVYNAGDISVGMRIYIHAIGTVNGLTIMNTITREMMTIDTTKLAALTGFGIIEGDDIIISTIRGNKFVYLQRDGVWYNILNAVGRYASWFQLAKGNNYFAYVAQYGESNLQFRIEHQIGYEGL